MHGKIEGQLYPQYESVKYTNISTRNLYGLPETFYPAKDVSWLLWHTLCHANKHKKIG